MEKASLYIATLLPPHGSTGVQTHIHAACELARTAGMKVDVVSPYAITKAVRGPLRRLANVLACCNAEYGVVLDRHILYLLVEHKLKAAINSAHAKTIIYAQDLLSARAALKIKQIRPSAQIILIVHFNISESWEFVLKGIAREGCQVAHYLAAVEKSVLPRVDRLIFVSEFMKKTVLARVPEAAKLPIWIVPNIVRAPRLQDSIDSSGDLVTIGTIEPRKNQAFLLRVLAETHRCGHPYRLTIIGDGEDEWRLKQLVHELALDNYVTCLGYVPDAADLISAHKVYVHAAVMESFGIALVEALARGKPVFAAPVGGITEIFDNGVEGFYWNLEDIRGSAQTLIQVLEDKDRYERLSIAARHRYDRQFNPEIVGSRLLQAVLQ